MRDVRVLGVERYLDDVKWPERRKLSLSAEDIFSIALREIKKVLSDARRSNDVIYVKEISEKAYLAVVVAVNEFLERIFATYGVHVAGSFHQLRKLLLLSLNKRDWPTYGFKSIYTDISSHLHGGAFYSDEILTRETYIQWLEEARDFIFDLSETQLGEERVREAWKNYWEMLRRISEEGGDVHNFLVGRPECWPDWAILRYPKIAKGRGNPEFMEWLVKRLKAGHGGGDWINGRKDLIERWKAEKRTRKRGSHGG